MKLHVIILHVSFIHLFVQFSCIILLSNTLVRFDLSRITVIWRMRVHAWKSEFAWIDFMSKTLVFHETAFRNAFCFVWLCPLQGLSDCLWRNRSRLSTIFEDSQSQWFFVQHSAARDLSQEGWISLKASYEMCSTNTSSQTCGVIFIWSIALTEPVKIWLGKEGYYSTSKLLHLLPLVLNNQ